MCSGDGVYLHGAPVSLLLVLRKNRRLRVTNVREPARGQEPHAEPWPRAKQALLLWRVSHCGPPDEVESVVAATLGAAEVDPVATPSTQRRPTSEPSRATRARDHKPWGSAQVYLARSANLLRGGWCVEPEQVVEAAFQPRGPHRVLHREEHAGRQGQRWLADLLGRQHVGRVLRHIRGQVAGNRWAFNSRIARKGIETSENLGRHRWVIERTPGSPATDDSTIRYERKANHFLAFLTLAAALTCFKKLRQHTT